MQIEVTTFIGQYVLAESSKGLFAGRVLAFDRGTLQMTDVVNVSFAKARIHNFASKGMRSDCALFCLAGPPITSLTLQGVGRIVRCSYRCERQLARSFSHA